MCFITFTNIELTRESP